MGRNLSRLGRNCEALKPENLSGRIVAAPGAACRAWGV
ncbi:hypothetical protein A2U01_0087994, partial [Trifolium medium]|nr:hypothetical protein [Trifolium medium]